MNRLWVEPGSAADFERLGLRSFDDVLRYFVGSEFLQPDRVFLKSATIQLKDELMLPVFYKQYEYCGGSWRYFCRASKARCEFENCAALAGLGIATAGRIACGEERDALGRLRRAFVITRAIPRAQPLPQFLAERRPNLVARVALLRQLAAMTRRIHDADFFHHDLYSRNVLVTLESGKPQLWWIDCPRGQFDRWSPLRQRRRIKDLASLDKSAVQSHFARQDRLRFLLEYLGKPRVDADVRRLAAAIVLYRRLRWPTDWHGR